MLGSCMKLSLRIGVQSSAQTQTRLLRGWTCLLQINNKINALRSLLFSEGKEKVKLRSQRWFEGLWTSVWTLRDQRKEAADRLTVCSSYLMLIHSMFPHRPAEAYWEYWEETVCVCVCVTASFLWGNVDWSEREHRSGSVTLCMCVCMCMCMCVYVCVWVWVCREHNIPHVHMWAD